MSWHEKKTVMIVKEIFLPKNNTTFVDSILIVVDDSQQLLARPKEAKSRYEDLSSFAPTRLHYSDLHCTTLAAVM